MARTERTNRRLNRKAMATASANAGEEKGGNPVKDVVDKEILGKVEIWNPREAKTYGLRVVPYTMTDVKHNPEITALPKGMKIVDGMVWAGRMFGIHRNVGGSGKNILCSKTTFGRPCWCCQEADRLRQDYDKNKDLFHKLKTELWAGYNVIETGTIKNPSDADPKKPVQKFFAWKFSKFGEKLKEEIDMGEPEILGYGDTEEGLCLFVRIVEDTFQKGTQTIAFKTTSKIDFKDMKAWRNLSDAVLDAALPLDDLFVITSNEVMQELYTGGSEDEDEDAPPPKKGKGKPAPEDDEDADEEEEAPKKAKKKPKPEPEEEDDDSDEETDGDDDGEDTDEDADDEDDDGDDDADDDTPPPAKTKGKAKKPPVDEDEDEDGDDDDSDGDDEDDSDDADADDDEPPAKAKGKAVVTRKPKPTPFEEDDDPPVVKRKAKPVVEDEDEDEEDAPPPKKAKKPGTKW